MLRATIKKSKVLPHYSYILRYAVQNFQKHICDARLKKPQVAQRHRRRMESSKGDKKFNKAYLASTVNMIFYVDQTFYNTLAQ